MLRLHDPQQLNLSIRAPELLPIGHPVRPRSLRQNPDQGASRLGRSRIEVSHAPRAESPSCDSPRRPVRPEPWRRRKGERNHGQPQPSDPVQRIARSLPIPQPRGLADSSRGLSAETPPDLSERDPASPRDARESALGEPPSSGAARLKWQEGWHTSTYWAEGAALGWMSECGTASRVQAEDRRGTPTVERIAAG